MKRMFSFFLALALLAVLSGCGKREPTPSRPDEPTPPPEEGITLAELNVEFVAGDRDTDALMQLKKELPPLLIGALADEGVTFGASDEATADALAHGSVQVGFMPMETYLAHEDTLRLVSVPEEPAGDTERVGLYFPVSDQNRTLRAAFEKDAAGGGALHAWETLLGSFWMDNGSDPVFAVPVDDDVARRFLDSMMDVNANGMTADSIPRLTEYVSADEVFSTADLVVLHGEAPDEALWMEIYGCTVGGETVSVSTADAIVGGDEFAAALLAALMLLGLCACSAQQTPAETTEPPAATNETASTTETEEISTEPESTDAEAATRTITDGNGREVEIPQTVESIVCVGVGALRYSCYMQAQDLVVGVEDYETKAGMSRLYNYVNFDKFGTLPVTGTNGEPFVEEIIHVGPQVIVMSSYANVDPDELQSKTGIPVVMVPGSDTTLDDKAYETLRILGELYGKEDRAEALTTYLHGIEDDLAARTEGVAEEEKPSVYVCGVSFKGAHGFEGTEAFYGPFELIHANNLANTTGQTGAFDIDTEQVLAWDPDVIFVDFNGMDLIKEDYATNADFYNSLTAVKEGRVYSQISFRSSASNLETALADAYYGATILYPEQFADVDVEAKTGEIFEMLLGSNPYQDLKDAGYEFRPVTIGE